MDESNETTAGIDAFPSTPIFEGRMGLEALAQLLQGNKGSPNNALKSVDPEGLGYLLEALARRIELGEMAAERQERLLHQLTRERQS